MEVTPTILLIYFVTLLCLGSALACLTWRFPRHKAAEWQQEARHLLEIKDSSDTVLPNSPSFTKGRSFCPSCLKRLAIRDLIPIVSFCVNRARCRFCRAPISYRYPLIEISYVLVLLPLLWIVQSPLEWLLLVILISSLSMVSIVDIEHFFIPDECNVLILGCGLLLALLSGNDLTAHILGMIIGYSVFYLIRFVYLLVRKVDMLGLGDVKLLAVTGAWLGVYELANIVLIASTSAIFFSLVRGLSKHNPLPFGPFIALASVTLYYWRQFYG